MVMRSGSGPCRSEQVRLALQADTPSAQHTAAYHLASSRYIDVLPYDHSRVKLRNEAYINANWIREPKLVDGSATKMRTWIASQAPLSSTTGDFLSMLIDLQPAPRIIVQLTPVRPALGIETMCASYLMALVSQCRTAGRTWKIKMRAVCPSAGRHLVLSNHRRGAAPDPHQPKILKHTIGRVRRQ